MKCDRCGKNEATFHYKTNINGRVTEAHLCPDCARAMGVADATVGDQAAVAHLLDALTRLNADLKVPSPKAYGIDEAELVRFRELRGGGADPRA